MSNVLISSLVDALKHPIADDIDLLGKNIIDVQLILSKLFALDVSKSERGSIKAFSEWFKKEIPDSSIGDIFEVANVWDGIGIFALKPCDANYRFISVPRRVFMCADNWDTKFASILRADPICSNIPSLLLVCRLIFEKLDPLSFWRPYIDL